MFTRGQANKSSIVGTNDSNSESDGDTTAVNIGESTAVQPPVNGTSDTLASLMTSIASLRDCVKELRNETSRSQVEVQQLRQRIETDAINATSSNVVPTSGVHAPFSQQPQITLPPAQSQASSSSNAMWLVESSVVKLHPLPTFDGNPEDWPLFSASFVDSTTQFSYNNRQNLMRLQRALQGSAKRAVTSMLIYPDDVPKVMKELEFNFGRQDLLIRCQLQKVQQFPAINDNHLDQILQFSNHVSNISAFFKSAKCEHHLMNPMLLEQLISKLPTSKQFEWSKYAANISPFPTVDVFSDWLSDLAKVVATMPGAINTSLRFSQQTLPPIRHSTNTNRQLGASGGPARRVLHSNKEQPSCISCNQTHVLTDCHKFQSLDLAAKWAFVKQHRLCFGCLLKGHNLLNCRRRKSCGISGCKRMHHQLLHKDVGSSTSSSDQQRILNCREDKVTSLFKILPVNLSGPKGKMSVYAMFDEGSSVSLLEEEVAAQLGLRGRVMPLTLQWYGDSQTTESSRMVSLEIGDVNSQNTYSLRNVHTIKGLHLPKQSFEKKKFKHFKALPVQSYEDVEPVLLLGLDNCHLSLSSEVIEAGCDQPVAADTKLGWVVYGPHRQESVAWSRVLHVRKSESFKQLNKLMEEYFSIESFGVRSTDIVLESDENKRARKILSETTKDLGHRYEVGLLWRQDSIKLPSSYAMAEQRLLNIESRMQKDAVYAESYRKEIAKYIDKGYARMLTPDEAASEGPRTWYLPHFGVVNPSKPQKLRIVFDAAATSNSFSLNSVLFKGPDQAQPLIAIVYKFRQGIVAVAGDIQEMFSQVKIRSADQDSQRFLWRDGKRNEPIQTYVMSSMIFGAICSPCCAEHVKNVNATKFSSSMPKGSHAVITSTYVDDLVISFNSADEALSVTTEAMKINAVAGFKLRNFISNNKKVQHKLNEENPDANSELVKMDRNTKTEKVLGMYWNTTNDGLEFHFQFHKIAREVLNGMRTPTKRELLGISMSIYDPFGLLANTTVFLKLLIQSLWRLHVEWDEAIPNGLAQKWSSWWINFQSVKRFTVPRCYSIILPVADEIQLHIFVDASSSAYAAVAYLRVKKERQLDVTLMCAKSRCTPLKGMTIPRLELQAAVLGCRLKESLVHCHDFHIDSTTFWSDSKTVILWIRSRSRTYKQFVACRISEILSTTSSDQWRWVPTALNVADEATRACATFQYDPGSRWLKGPSFLSEDETCWPQETLQLTSEYCAMEEVAGRVMLTNPIEYPIKFSNFSLYSKVVRVVAWVLRFLHNTKSDILYRGELNAMEIANAEKSILRRVQTESFADEIKALEMRKGIPKTSSLYQLTPFIDDDNLLKVNGRIDSAYCLPITARRPVILPHDHYVTRMIVHQYHSKLHHQNDRLTINEIRQKYWVPRVYALLKSVKKKCPVCIYTNAKPVTPLMGQLPPDRLTPYVRPFSYAGVDYCGPFVVAIGRRREKRWVALFTCLTTRAVHLEISEDLSTDAFIICFRNFVNRRGVPVKIRSDNGTNFVGAQKELDKENRLFDFNRIEQEMARQNIQWVFNCPANPSAGGCWERLVQCTKRLLQRVLKEEAPRLETFRSVLIEAENIVNSRPLTELPITPQDEEPLTPNHFLLGCLNSTQTPNIDEENVCLRKQWRISQNLKDRLWKRWTVEYLPQLLRRSKWRDQTTALQPGQLVIVCDHTRPRSQWERGRVTEVFTAKDGHVRSAQVRTASGSVRRPASKLAALENGQITMIRTAKEDASKGTNLETHRQHTATPPPHRHHHRTTTIISK